MSVLWSNETLIDKRRQKPFRVFAPSPSWLEEENQILTPREWYPTGPIVTGKKMLWILAGAVALFGFAIGFGWGWVFPIGQ